MILIQNYKYIIAANNSVTEIRYDILKNIWI